MLFSIIEISFDLSKLRCHVYENTNGCIEESHIIKQLGTMFLAKISNRL